MTDPAADRRDPASAGETPRVAPRRWFLKGVGNLLSVPAFILMTATAGSAALAREAGLGLGEAVFLTFSTWALPSQVVYVGLVAGGAALPAVMAGVALSAVRFMPMVMAWAPVVRGPRTRRWQLYVLSWFVAITAWVFAMARLPDLPRPARVPFFAGFAISLTLVNGCVVVLAYYALGAFPPVVAAMLLLLTPVYFLLALWGAARLPVDRLALGAGLVLAPAFSFLAPDLDLLLSGLVGGTLAYLASRLARARRGRR